jgi:hypothetical protein
MAATASKRVDGPRLTGAIGMNILRPWTKVPHLEIEMQRFQLKKSAVTKRGRSASTMTSSR